MNTKLFGLFIALLVCLPSLAQQKPVEKVDSDGVYLMPDQMPEFPGGMQAMMKFLTTNIKYPVEAQKKGVSGRVIVQFVIMEDGTLDQAKVVRGIDPLLDEEALRVVKLMPKWKPGMDRGEAVKVRFTAPIMFNLSRPEAQRPTFPELVVPIGQEVENRSLQGVWQSCVVQPGEHGYKILLLPVLKTHGVQDIETLQAFVTGIDVRSDVSQWMSHVQACAAGVGEHVQYIIFLFCFVFRHLVGFVLHPLFLPFFFNLSEIVFHNGFNYIVENLLIYLLKLVDSLFNSVYILLIKRCKVKGLFSDL